MVLPFLPWTRRDPSPRVSLPADFPPPSSQGGSSSGARADVARKMNEVEHLLANLEKEGVEIDGKIASIIDDEVARIKAEAARENISGPLRNGMIVLLTVTSIALGFVMGVDWYGLVLFERVAKRIVLGEK